MMKNTVLYGLSSLISCSYALIDLDHAGAHHEKLAEKHHEDQKLLFTPSHLQETATKGAAHHEDIVASVPHIETIKRHGHHID